VLYSISAGGRRDAHLALRANGIPAVTWGGVIHSTLPIQEFPEADFLYHHLVMLPIHQSIDDAGVRMMIDTLAKVLESAEG
jgi:dTDP-4-amino-4,6-dideoxygalactose transaminase